MNKTDPLVSIIVPAYNTGRYIGVCIGTLVTQSYYNLEIIIVDDGSTDHTKKTVEGFAKQDKRIRLINGSHLGANIARGLGVEKATGDYYMFVDSDDWLEEDAVEKLVDIMLGNKCDIIRFNAVMEPSKKLKNPLIDDGSVSKLLSRDEARLVLTMTPILNNLCFQFYCAKLFKNMKSFWIQLSNGEDFVNNLEIYENVESVLCIGDVLYHYRDNYGSTTKNSDSDRCLVNLTDLIYAYSTMIKQMNTWRFSKRERADAAARSLDKIRGAMFAFSKSNGMAKERFVNVANSLLDDDGLKYIRESTSKKDIEKYYHEQPLSYKIKSNGGLVLLYEGKMVSFWRATLVLRSISRTKYRIHESSIAKWVACRRIMLKGRQR